MNKFEQLIEYVINDEEQKARELFHDIVVEKSRAIYEEMMDDESVDESKEEDDESIEEATEEEDESIEEGMLGGDQADDLIDDVESEEEGMAMENDAEFDDEAEEAGNDVTKDIEGEGDLEDRVVDLEDKLDELMAEFEALMGDEGGEAAGDDAMDMDAEVEVGDGMTDMEIDDDELETEGMMYNENVTLKPAPKPVTSEEGNTNKKSTVAANAGARGAMAHPVKMTGDTAKGRPAPAVKDMPGYQGDGHYGKPGAAPKPHLAQAAGVNTTSVIK
jgi:hypothetical protein